MTLDVLWAVALGKGLQGFSQAALLGGDVTARLDFVWRSVSQQAVFGALLTLLSVS